jgi:hypothetical protein
VGVSPRESGRQELSPSGAVVTIAPLGLLDIPPLDRGLRPRLLTAAPPGRDTNGPGRSDCPAPAEDLVEHRLRQLPRERVLLAGVVGRQGDAVVGGSAGSAAWTRQQKAHLLKVKRQRVRPEECVRDDPADAETLAVFRFRWQPACKSANVGPDHVAQ